MDNNPTEPIPSTPTPVSNSQEPTAAPSLNPPNEPKTLNKNRTWLILGIVIGTLVLITIIAITSTILVLSNRSVPPPAPPPTVTTTPTPIPVIPTKYSTDSAILKLRDDLKSLMAKTDTVDLVEPEIAPPNLELNLKIQPLQ